METMVIFLNMFLTPESELRLAFHIMEGEGFYEFSSKSPFGNSIREFWDRCEQLMKEGKFDSYPEDMAITTIYGAGGGHRYFVYKYGRILYSRGHGRSDAEKARNFGFEILEN